MSVIAMLPLAIVGGMSVVILAGMVTSLVMRRLFNPNGWQT